MATGGGVLRFDPLEGGVDPASDRLAGSLDPIGCGTDVAVESEVGGDSCQTEHIGYLISGTMGVQTTDGTTGEVKPGSVYHIAPGHDGWVIGDEPVVVVEFQGAANYAKA